MAKLTERFRIIKCTVVLYFSNEDAVWVKQNVIDPLEEEFNFRLCVHKRDFLPGAPIITNITAAIEHSRRMIMVLTK